MTEEPGKRYGAVWAWPEDGGIWRYLPCAPSPQRGDTGRANVTVIEAGGMLMLTVGARLGVDPADLVTAQKAIAAQQKVAETTILLRPAEASVTAASLRIVEPSGEGVELATARPSNLPPYSAAFSAMVSGDAATAAKTAMGEGRLVVRYDVGLPKRLVVKATVRGDWTGEGSLDAALETAKLVLEMQADEGASEALIAKALQRARQEAVATAARMRSDPDAAGCAATAGIEVEVMETEAVQQTLSLQSDVASWLK